MIVIMIVLHCGKPTFISLPVSPPIHRSKSAKFQLWDYGPKYNNFHANCTAIIVICFCFFFLNPEAEIMLNMLFKTLFKKTRSTQYAKEKKKKRKNNGWTFTTIFAVGHPSLYVSAATKPSFARVIARYVFLVLKMKEFSSILTTKSSACRDEFAYFFFFFLMQSCKLVYYSCSKRKKLSFAFLCLSSKKILYTLR